jgi:NAD-dependent SIR2 family protein deacetylase
MNMSTEDVVRCDYCQKKITRHQQLERYHKGKRMILCHTCEAKMFESWQESNAKTTKEGGGRIGKQLRLDNGASGKRAKEDPLKGAGGEGGG